MKLRKFIKTKKSHQNVQLKAFSGSCKNLWKKKQKKSFYVPVPHIIKQLHVQAKFFFIFFEFELILGQKLFKITLKFNLNIYVAKKVESQIYFRVWPS